MRSRFYKYRKFIPATLAAIILTGFYAKDSLSEPTFTEFSFIAVGDLHYGKGSEYVADRTAWNRKQVRAINAVDRPNTKSALQGMGFSTTSNGNINWKGVLVLGDVTNDGQEDEWNDFLADFGLNANAILDFPVFETGGNHEYPRVTSQVNDPTKYDHISDFPVLKAIRDRNSPANNRGIDIVMSHSASGSYAWIVNSVLFINLGLKPSNDNNSFLYDDLDGDGTFSEGDLVTRRTPPFNSLNFLSSVLSQYGGNNRKVIIGFHYPAKTGEPYYTANERSAFFQVIKDYNIIAFLTGHRHRSGWSKWCGVPVLEVGSPEMSWSRPGTTKRLNYYSVFTLVDVQNTGLLVQTAAWDEYINDPGPAKKDLALVPECVNYIHDDVSTNPDVKLKACYNKFFAYSSNKLNKNCTDF